MKKFIIASVLLLAVMMSTFITADAVTPPADSAPVPVVANVHASAIISVQRFMAFGAYHADSESNAQAEVYVQATLNAPYHFFTSLGAANDGNLNGPSTPGLYFRLTLPPDGVGNGDIQTHIMYGVAPAGQWDIMVGSYAKDVNVQIIF